MRIKSTNILTINQSKAYEDLFIFTYILDALKTFKHKVIWKHEEAETMAKQLPSNILVRKWLPQSDILAHKNVRLFISHAGMFGTFEVSFILNQFHFNDNFQFS